MVVIHTAIRIRTVLLSYCLIYGEFIGNRVSSEHGHLTIEENPSMPPKSRTVSSDSGLGCRLTGEPSAVRAPHPHHTPIHRKPGVSLSYPIHVLFVKSHRKHGVFPRCTVPPVTAVTGVKSRGDVSPETRCLFVYIRHEGLLDVDPRPVPSNWDRRSFDTPRYRFIHRKHGVSTGYPPTCGQQLVPTTSLSTYDITHCVAPATLFAIS